MAVYGGQRAMVGHGSLLPLCGTLGSNAGFQAWWEHPSPSGPRVKDFIISLSHVWVIVLGSSHLFPPAMCHAPLSLFVSDRPPPHPAHLEAEKFPRLTLHSLADVCQGPGGKPHTEPVQAVCCRFYQLQCAKKLQHGARATPSNMAGRSSRQRQNS